MDSNFQELIGGRALRQQESIFNITPEAAGQVGLGDILSEDCQLWYLSHEGGVKFKWDNV